MRRLVSFAGVVGVALAVASPFLLGGSDVVDGLGNLSLYVVVALAAMATCSALAKGAKLYLLMRGLGQYSDFWHVFAISLATDFAFLASPAGAAGYAVNIALLRRAGASWSVATTVVGADQALDLVFFIVAVPLAVFFALGPLAQVLPEFSLRAYLVALCVFLLALTVLWHIRGALMSTVHRLIANTRWLRTRQTHLQQFLHDMRMQLLALAQGDRRRSGAILLLTAIQWLLRYGALWFALLSLGHRLPFGFILVLQSVVLHLAQWTGIPAGGGSADLGLAAALAPWVTKAVMATVLLLWRFATLYFPLLIGMLSLIVLFHGWRAAREFEPMAEDEAR